MTTPFENWPPPVPPQDRSAAEANKRIARVLFVLGLIAIPFGFFAHPAFAVVGFMMMVVAGVGVGGPIVRAWFDRKFEAGRFHSPGAVAGVLVAAVVVGSVADKQTQESVGDGLSILLGVVTSVIVFAVGLVVADNLPRPHA